MFDPGAGEIEDALHRTPLVFELEFGQCDRMRLRAGHAGVQCDFDVGALGITHPAAQARHVGGVALGQRRQRRGLQGRGQHLGGVAAVVAMQIDRRRRHAGHWHFVLEAMHGALAGGLERLRPAPPLLPQAQRHSVARQPAIGGVEVAGLQAHRLGAMRAQRAAQRRQGRIGHSKLEFKFAHRVPGIQPKGRTAPAGAVSLESFGRRDWTRTNDPHHVKVVL